ncbi:MAG: hypothetical protein Q9217_003337 [Psora testacea]
MEPGRARWGGWKRYDVDSVSESSKDDGFEYDVQILRKYSFISFDMDRTFEMHALVQRLTESCQNLWNETGSFEWHYRTSSELKGPDVNPNLGQDQNSRERSPSPAVTTDSPPVPLADQDSHHPGIQSYSTSPNKSLLGFGPIHNAAPDSVPGFWTPYDSIEDVEPGSTPIAMRMSTCFLCNERFPSDLLCLVCFGPLPSMLESCDAASQDIFGSFPSIDIWASVPKIASREATPLDRGNEAWQSDALASSDLLGSELTSGSPKQAEFFARSRGPMKKEMSLDAKDKSDRGKVTGRTCEANAGISNRGDKSHHPKPLKRTEKTPRRPRMEYPMATTGGLRGLLDLLPVS